MSNTNHGGSQPDPVVSGLAPHAPGSPRGDDHHGGAVDPAAVRQGHESDGYDTRSVIGVPILVIVFFVLAFGTTTALFAYFAHVNPDPNAHPAAVARNQAPLNERLDRIHRGGEVDQPRLEPLRKRTGQERAITSPETATGNPPQLHPEDIRANPENTPELYKTGMSKEGKTRITIDEAMKAAVGGKLLPAAKAGTEPAKSTNVPSAANAGRGADAAVATPPQLPGQANPKPPAKKEGAHP